MLSVVMQSDIIQSVIIPNVIKPSVMVPKKVMLHHRPLWLDLPFDLNVDILNHIFAGFRPKVEKLKFRDPIHNK